MFFIPYYYAFFFIINVRIVYSLFNASSLNMGKGKADGTGFLSKLTRMTSRSGRPRTFPSRLLEDDSSQGGRGRGAPRGGQGRGQKHRSLTDLGVSSSRPSSTEEEEEEEEEVQEEEEEVGEGDEVQEEEEVGEGDEEEEDGGGGEDGGGSEGFAHNKGWLRGNAKLPPLPATEEQKWLIEPKGKE